LLEIVAKLSGYVETIIDVNSSSTELVAEFATLASAQRGDTLIKDFATRGCGFHISASDSNETTL
jgi:hypothetical protein